MVVAADGGNPRAGERAEFSSASSEVEFNHSPPRTSHICASDVIFNQMCIKV